jgi:hypothetical protein
MTSPLLKLNRQYYLDHPSSLFLTHDSVDPSLSLTRIPVAPSPTCVVVAAIDPSPPRHRSVSTSYILLCVYIYIYIVCVYDILDIIRTESRMRLVVCLIKASACVLHMQHLE